MGGRPDLHADQLDRRERRLAAGLGIRALPHDVPRAAHVPAGRALPVRATAGALPDGERREAARTAAGRAVRRTARTLAIIAVLVLDAIIVVSHQLTPYAAILTVLPLALLGYLRPRWIGFAMAVITIAYLIPNLGFVQSNWGLLSSFDPLKNLTFKPPATAAAQATPTLGFIVETQAVNVINLLSIGLGLFGMVRRFRSGDPRSAVTVLFAFASALILAVQTYGGEGLLRVLLLSFAWTSIGAIWALWPMPRDLVWSRVMVSGLVVVLLGLFVVAFFQPEADYRIAPADAAAGTWINSVLRDGDSVVRTLPVFPDVVGPNYGAPGRTSCDGRRGLLPEQPAVLPHGQRCAAARDQGRSHQRPLRRVLQSQYTYAQAHHLVSAPLLAPSRAQRARRSRLRRGLPQRRRTDLPSVESGMARPRVHETGPPAPARAVHRRVRRSGTPRAGALRPGTSREVGGGVARPQPPADGDRRPRPERRSRLDEEGRDDRGHRGSGRGTV